jgi:hypothetical protein
MADNQVEKYLLLISSSFFNRFFSNSAWTTVIPMTTIFAASWQPFWS